MNNLSSILTVGVVGLLAGCGTTQFTSQWRDRDIVIDGSVAEWGDLVEYPAYITPNIGLGAVCDGNNVCLCLTSSDRATVSKILGAGFSITFKTPKQKGSLFGVYFPLGMKGFKPGPGDRDPETMTARLEASLQMLGLLGPGKKDTVFIPVARAESLGVVVRVSAQSMEQCTYELKVPLKKTTPSRYAVVPGNNGSLEVTFETGAMQRPEGKHPHGGRGAPPGGGGGMPPGDGPGFGGGGPPGGGGSGFDKGGPGDRHGPPPGMQESLKVSFMLKLAQSALPGK